MHNEHIILYYKFMSWLAKRHGRQWQSELLADAARQEREDQERFIKMQESKATVYKQAGE